MKLLIAEDNITRQGYSLLPDSPSLQLTGSAPWTIPHE